ncbi:MAG: hypothetical protein WCF90_04330 [Methanomicrobiales archaeon]
MHLNAGSRGGHEHLAPVLSLGARDDNFIIGKGLLIITYLKFLVRSIR